jgi:hypothetical protein
MIFQNTQLDGAWLIDLEPKEDDESVGSSRASGAGRSSRNNASIPRSPQESLSFNRST